MRGGSTMQSRTLFGGLSRATLLGLAFAGLAVAGAGCGGGNPEQQDAGPQGRCTPVQPYGECPAGRVCRSGACIVDLDPGTPITSEYWQEFAEWVWEVYDARYANFASSPVDWSDVHQRLTADVAAATTQYEAVWAIMRAVGELNDGHNGVLNDWFCEQTASVYPLDAFMLNAGMQSNLGACLTETAEAFVVYHATPDNPMGLVPGDEILAVDGRTMEEALADLDAQPRCWASFSTPASRRHLLVSSVMYRPATDRSMRVRRADGTEADLDIQPLPANGVITCYGRIGVPDTVAEGEDVESAVLPGNVLYVSLPRLCNMDEHGNLTGAALTAVLRDLVGRAQDAAGLILDIRGNPGGLMSVVMALASWLLPEPTLLFSEAERSGPGHDDFADPFVWTSEPDRSLQMTRPFALLVNERCGSAADFMALWVHTTGRGKLFGAASSGSFGSGYWDTTRPGWTIAYNRIQCRDAAGNTVQSKPPAPDFPVIYTAADIRNGVDTVIEAARAWVVAQ
jgi:C-terminal processing protease CtpA/Prc